MTSSPFEAKVESIASILRGALLIVPRYQRPFAWDSAHVSALLEDLARAAVGGRPFYFLGTMAFAPANANGRMEIVDGQQRIAVFALIFAHLCRHSRERGFADGENKLLRALFNLPEQHDKTSADADALEPRVLLSANDRADFESLICGYNIARKSKITAAWRAIDEFFLREGNASADARRQFLLFVLDRAIVARVDIQDALIAVFVHETMNARGRRLESAASFAE